MAPTDTLGKWMLLIGSLKDAARCPTDSAATLVGKEVALSSIFIVIASILHSFNLSQEVDEHGNPIALKYTYLSTINK